MSNVLKHVAKAFALTTIFVAATQGFADPQGSFSPWHSTPPGIKDDRLDWHVSKQLDVNPETTHRLVVQGLCEADGERDLIRLSSVATTEEAFVFVPSLCLWIEVGLAESAKSVRLDSAFIDTVLLDHSHLVLYHIHPGDPAEAAGYFPAYSDMIGMILTNASFFDRSDVDIRHRAISAIGVIDYDFLITERTLRLVETMKETGLGGAIAQNLAYTYASSERETQYYEALSNCQSLISGQPERLPECFPISAGDFVLDFRSFTAE